MPDTKLSTSSPSPPPDLDILGDQVTIHPSGYVEPTIKHDEAHERNLVEHMARFRESPLDFLREVTLHVSGSGWRAYDEVIGQPIFYSGFSENMKAMVMMAPMLQDKIGQLVRKRLDVEWEQGLLGQGQAVPERRAEREREIQESLQEVVAGLIDGMICKMESKRFIRGAYYLCTQLLTRAYHQGVLMANTWRRAV